MMPGTDVKVTLLRDGKEQTVTVRLGELQASSGGRRATAVEARAEGSGFGLSVEPLTRDTARQLGVGAIERPGRHRRRAVEPRG